MTEWHLPPDYILDNWTDEQFNLMIEKLIERKQREADAIEDARKGRHHVSAESLAATSRGMIEVKHGN